MKVRTQTHVLFLALVAWCFLLYGGLRLYLHFFQHRPLWP